MPTTLETWEPYQVANEFVRRLHLISEANGYNTNPDVSELWQWPEQIPSGSLPAVIVLEDRLEPVEGMIGGEGSLRGRLRMQTVFFVWGIVESAYDIRAARHELLADVKSALFSGEALPTADGRVNRALMLGIEGVEYDGGALQETSRGFFVAEVVARFDMTRGV